MHCSQNCFTLKHIQFRLTAVQIRKSVESTNDKYSICHNRFIRENDQDVPERVNGYNSLMDVSIIFRVEDLALESVEAEAMGASKAGVAQAGRAGEELTGFYFYKPPCSL